MREPRVGTKLKANHGIDLSITITLIVTTTTRSTEATNFYDTVKNNYIRIVDEITKAQPQYTQSVSNLQLDYIAATKNTIQNMVSAQKMLASNGNVPIVTPPYTDEFVKQSNEITENIVRAVRINKNLTPAPQRHGIHSSQYSNNSSSTNNNFFCFRFSLFKCL